MGRYHINKTTGRVALCRAVKRCPFGDLEKDHYPSQKEASEAYETLMSEKILPRPQVASELKKMDANDLAHGFLDLASKRGLNVEKLSEALEFASLLHAGQKRQNRGRHDTTPYIEHPLRVSYRLLKLGVKDQAVITAALLHDTVEDCAQTFVTNIKGSETPMSENAARQELAAFIEKNYGEETMRIVLSVTNDHRPKEVSASMTQEEKNIEYKAHLQKEIVDNPPALLVKYSDFMDNAGGLHHNDIPGREKRIKNMASKYQPCVEIFVSESHKPSPYLDEDARKKCLDNLERADFRLKGLLDKYANL